MKKLIRILLIATVVVLFAPSCQENICECYYVTYESNPTNNYNWTETYRSTWDASCESEFLDESVYTASNGNKWYSRTYIECE